MDRKESSVVKQVPLFGFAAALVFFVAAGTHAITPTVSEMIGGQNPAAVLLAQSSTLAQPSMNAVQCNADGTSATLSWGSVSGAAVYAVRVDDSTNNTSNCLDGWYCNSTQDHLNDANTNRTVTRTIVPGRTYSWWVHAKYANTWNGTSGSTKVSFNCPPPVAQILPQPTMNAVQCNAGNTSVTLSWGSVTGAEVYALRIDDTTNNSASCTDGWYCANSQDYLIDTNTTRTITKSITPGRSYSWWVHAKKVNTWTGLSTFTKVNFSCETVLPNANVPVGFFDSASGGVLSGWALDKDVPSQSISVAIYMDGPKGVGQLIATVPANTSRPDVNSDQRVTGNHGFSWTIPQNYLTSHTWYIYGVDASGTTLLTQLFNSPKTYAEPALPQPTMNPFSCNADGTSATLSWGSVTGAAVYALRVDDTTNNASSCTDGWYCNANRDLINDSVSGITYTSPILPGVQYRWWVHAKKANTWTGLSESTKVNFSCGTAVYAPVGFFDSTTGGVLKGWAVDKDVPSRSINVAIYMDGPKGVGQLIATIPTNTSRPDVNSDQGVTGNHGFLWTIPNQYAGSHTWYIYGVEASDPNQQVLLIGGPKTYATPNNTYSKTKFGIVYELWHCDGMYNGYLWDTSKALVGEQPWGPIPNFMWWTEPAAGYYCYGQTQNWANIIRGHAETLRDAGVEFVVLDISNWDSRSKFDTAVAIEQPLLAMLPIWNSVPNAPKIVQWTPLTSVGDEFAWVQQQLDQYPNLQFIYEGKPLAIVVSIGDGASFPVDAGKYNAYAQNYTMRQMWAMKALNVNMPADAWSVFEPCQNGFLQFGGAIDCNQPITYKINGPVEQIAVATSYQISYATNVVDDVPKFQGRTFAQQFKTAFNHPEAPIVILDAWNEWIGQRMCLPQPGQPYVTNCTPQGDHWGNGMKVFVDSYDYERSRDIEPSKKAPYDYYYKLMKTCISKFRQGQLCTHTDVPYIAPPQVVTSPSVPEGWLDDANCSSMGGWARDPDTPALVIDVSIYADGVEIARIPAGGYRLDLCDEHGSCNHAFGFTTPASLKNGAPHTIQVYGRDNAHGSLTELLGSPKVIQCSGTASADMWSGNIANALSSILDLFLALVKTS